MLTLIYSRSQVSRVPAWIAVVALGLCLTGTAGAQNLIADGSFETGTVPNCNQAQVPSTSFSVLSSPDVYSFDCGTLPGVAPTSFGNFTTLAAAHDGLRYLGGAHTSFVESFGQTLAAPLTPGETYRLGGAFTVSDRFPEPGVYDVYLSTSLATTAPDATLLASLGDTAVIGSWTTEQALFVAPANAAVATNILMVPRSLAITPSSYPGSDSWSLVHVPSTPVLGSFGTAALVSGFVTAGLAAVRRRSS
jgi:hypothetical protein